MKYYGLQAVAHSLCAFFLRLSDGSGPDQSLPFEVKESYGLSMLAVSTSLGVFVSTVQSGSYFPSERVGVPESV